MRQLLIFLSLSILLSSCTNQEYDLTGKRIYHDWNSDSIHIFLPEKSLKFELPKNKLNDFSSPIWLRNEDKFLIRISEKSVGNNCYNYFIGLFDLKGTLIDTIYKEMPCNIIHFMQSKNDSLILIRRFKYSDWKQNSFQDNIWHEHKLTYLIYNIYKNQITDSISFQSGLYLDNFHESVWSVDCQRVLVSKKPEQSIYNRKHEEWYIFDIKTGDTLYIDIGDNFIWSPIQDNLISYLKDNTIWFYRTDSKNFEKFYQLPKEKKIKSFSWSPNGTELLIHYGKHATLLKPLGSKISWFPYDLLINVKDKTIKKKSGHEVIDSWK